MRSMDEKDSLLGNYLGQFTSELDAGDHILEFAVAGPKNYGYVTSLETSLGYHDPNRQHHIDDYIAQGSRKNGTDRSLAC